MRRILIAVSLVIAALGIAPLPAGAEVASSSAPGRPHRPSMTGGVVGANSDPRPLRETAPYDRIGQALTRPRSLGGSEMIALHELTDDAATDSDTGADWGYGIPIGDVDGDGLEELVTFESLEDGAAIVGRSGTSGTSLWRIELPHRDALVTGSVFTYSYTWVAVEDGDGDGVGDLVVFSVSGGPYGSGAAIGIPQVVAAYDGKSGMRRWGWERYGTAASASSSIAEAHLLDDVVWNLSLAADVTGDGLTDPFVQTCDRVGGSTGAVENLTFSAPHNACTALHLDRVTGEVARSFESPGDAVVSPVGDLNGDSLGDVVISEPFAGRFLDVRAADARGDEFWGTVTERYDYSSLLTVNLRAAPGNDLVLVGHRFDEEASDFAGFDMHALGGTAGNTLWSRAFPMSDDVVIADDIDADGGSDLIHISVSQSTIATGAYDGARFRTRLWVRRTTTVDPPPGMQLQASGYLPGDLSGDGINEIVVTPYVTSLDEFDELGAFALDGRTGDERFTVPAGDAVPFPLGGDVDGNGTPDLQRSVGTVSGIAIEIIDGSTLDPIWRTAPNADARSFYAQAADLTADPGMELLTYWNTRDGNLVTAETEGRRIWGLSYSYRSSD